MLQDFLKCLVMMVCLQNAAQDCRKRANKRIGRYSKHPTCICIKPTFHLLENLKREVAKLKKRKEDLIQDHINLNQRYLITDEKNKTISTAVLRHEGLDENVWMVSHRKIR